MALDEAGMHRAGLGFLYRIIPVLVATILYGQTSSDGSMLKLTIVSPRHLYRDPVHCYSRTMASTTPPLPRSSVSLTCIYSYRHKGLKNPYNALILAVLYVVFCLSSALWALEVAQLIGLVDLLLYPDGLSTDALFNRFYDLIASETRVTGILFQTQVSMCACAK